MNDQGATLREHPKLCALSILKQANIQGHILFVVMDINVKVVVPSIQAGSGNRGASGPPLLAESITIL
jgi:hypothetical protein